VVTSRREALTTWTQLTTIVKFVLGFGLLATLWLFTPAEKTAAASTGQMFPVTAASLQTAGPGLNPVNYQPAQIEPTGVLSDTLVLPPTPDKVTPPGPVDGVCPQPEETLLSEVQDRLISGLFNRVTSVAGTLAPDSVLTERVNILLLGSDSRSDDKQGRTDTIILATIDPATQTAGLLSIPRDLWVVIPQYGEQRINTAYRLGQRIDYPGGGIALLKETIEANLGVPVHYYILVDFEGFKQIIEALGGLDICVPETLDAATHYGYPVQWVNKEEYYSFVPVGPDGTIKVTQPKIEPAALEEGRPAPVDQRGYEFLYIEAGWHTLDGATALRYARSRASATSDFARVRRQQDVLLAIRHKVLRLGLVPELPNLWQTMKQTVETDLQLVDVLQLARLGYDIPQTNIRTEAIGIDQTSGFKTSNGAQVLLPHRTKIQSLIISLFGQSEPTAPQTQAELELSQAAAAQSDLTPARASQADHLQTKVWQ
jgi:LCP family protein required for cell wall assembly